MRPSARKGAKRRFWETILRAALAGVVVEDEAAAGSVERLEERCRRLLELGSAAKGVSGAADGVDALALAGVVAGLTLATLEGMVVLPIPRGGKIE